LFSFVYIVAVQKKLYGWRNTESYIKYQRNLVLGTFENKKFEKFFSPYKRSKFNLAI